MSQRVEIGFRTAHLFRLINWHVKSINVYITFSCNVVSAKLKLLYVYFSYKLYTAFAKMTYEVGNLNLSDVMQLF